jgi:ssDNA-binding Zn-finger/Zn-ribbon topoisomerase 1
MTIDLNQLPIPAWDVQCPKCRYPLAGLPSHRCPECGTTFNIREVIQTWTRLRAPRFTGAELPIPDFGLVCPACKHPAVGWTSRSCPECGRSVEVAEWLPLGQWFVVDQELVGRVHLAAVEALLGAELVPYMHVRDAPAREIMMGPRAIGMRLRVPIAFYFDALWLIQQVKAESAGVREGRTADWLCADCGEQVPGHFDLCWNCQQARET